jgi:glucose/arabinose dehydrogenase
MRTETDISRRQLLIRAGLASAAALLGGCRPSARGGDGAADEPASGTAAAQENAGSYKVETVVTGLEVPWAIVFTSPTRMLVTERPGRLRVVENGRLQERPLESFSDVASSEEEGLMGLALHPEYAKNRLLYLAYAYQQRGTFDRVVRFKDEGDRLTDRTTIIEGIPAAQYHAGCALAFGPDGKLYITTGDATERQLAQQKDSLAGKILRLNPDGSIPGDNPFSGSPIWSLGHRNPQGIDWHPTAGLLFSTEHGPSGFDGPGGGDEVNIIRKGENNGWPVVHHTESREGMVDPLLVYTPAVAPASAAFYAGDKLSDFRNDFFFGCLRGECLMRVVLDPKDPTRVVRDERLFRGEYGRIRAVTPGPDGALYFSTSNRDGRGSPTREDDRILRVVAA